MRTFPYLLPLVLLTLAGSSVSALATPLITEFLANNNTGIVDADNTRQDWIEIHNPDPTTLDLGGYTLTDSAAIPAKWVFPAGYTIPAGGYVVVFASNKDRRTLGSALHTNFSLSASGEYLGLYAPGGGAALSEYAPTFPAQTADVSYGMLNPVLGSLTGYFDVPSPGVANPPGSSRADVVRFSLSSRTFNQGSTLTVSLSTPTLTPTIRYTVNRAIPIAATGITGDFTVDPATDICTMTAHGLTERDEVQVATTGTLPVGLGLALNYYVVVLSANTFKLSDSPGGTPVDITAVGTGVNSVRRQAAYFTAAITDICTTAYHPFYDWDQVQVSSTGSLPAPLLAGTNYYIQLIDRNTYRLTATPGGVAIDLTTTGAGTMTIRRIPSPIYAGALTVNYSQRIRARAFEAGRPDGPIASEAYLALDAAAQTFTSNLPIMILHSWGSGHPNAAAPTGTTPEDTKQAVWFTFEPKLEGTAMVARMTNLPDLATPGYFERRGSSTFGALKYSMTMGALDESNAGKDVSPLGFASNDDFVLNAPYQYDRSLMHNDMIYRLSNEAGRWAPRTRHVEVFQSVDNEVAASGTTPAWGYVAGATTGADYYGVYSFQDKIKRGSGRLDIEKMNATDNTAPNVQGGYIFKIDRLDLGDAGVAAAGRTFALVQPKEYTSYPSHLPVMTAAQKTYLATTLNNMYAACTGPNLMSPTLGYQAHFDVPAIIDHHLFSTAAKSADAFRLSGYWHKSRFGKLVMGPIFDFDRAMGSTEPSDPRSLLPTTWRCDTSDFGTDFFHNNAAIFTPNYFDYMFQDPNFWQAWVDRLEELRQGVLSTAHVHAIIDEYTELLDPGNGANTPAKRNFQKFTSVLPVAANANSPGTDGTFRGEARWLKNWWGKAGAVTANGRLDFMDGQFIRPAVPSLAAGPVASGATMSLSSPSQATSGVKIYYTLNGTDPRPQATVVDSLAALGTVSTPLDEVNPVRAIVPTSAAVGGTIGTEWRGADLNSNGNNQDDFNDSTWFTNAVGAKSGVGYDDSTVSPAVDYLPFLGLRWNTATFSSGTVNTSNVMRSGTIGGTAYAGNQTCYIRLPFTLSSTDAALLVSPNKLILQMRYDDGFIAYLNGVEVAKANQPATYPTLAYNSAAATTHADPDSIIFQTYDITAFMANAHVGNNILAIHGLNSGLGSSDLIQQAKLTIQGGKAFVPAFAPAAVEYTGPLTITAPTQIFARTLNPVRASDPPTYTGGGTGPVPNGSSWSAPTKLYYFPGAATASPSNIQISEVLYHPAPPTAAEITAGYLASNDFEFIRLTNLGAAPVDLTGMYFSNGLNFTAAPGLQNWLPVGASVVVVENRNAFISRYGSTFTILGEFTGELDDGGEHIVLNDKTGAVIADFVYGDTAPWPVEADDGHSLLYVAGPVGMATSWVASVDAGGSAVTNYTTWTQRNFTVGTLAADKLAAADPDHDGLNNLGEYAFATDPLTCGTREATLASGLLGSPGAFTATRRKGATDVTYIPQMTTTLQDWTPVTAPPTITDNGNGTETCTWTLPTGSPGRVFVRVMVTTP